MKLNVNERFAILGLLPKEGNFLTLKIIREQKELLSFSDDEVKEYEFTVNGDNVNWNIEKEKKEIGEKDIKITNTCKDIIIAKLKELDQKNKLAENYFTIYEKFIMN
jgi:hypothetical protein